MRTVVISLALSLSLSSLARAEASPEAPSAAVPDGSADAVGEAPSDDAPSDAIEGDGAKQPAAAADAEDAEARPADAPAAAVEAAPTERSEDDSTGAAERALLKVGARALHESNAPSVAPSTTEPKAWHQGALAKAVASGASAKSLPASSKEDAPCLAREVVFKRFGLKEQLALALTDCEGRPNLDALPLLSALAQPLPAKIDPEQGETSEPLPVQLDPGLLTRVQHIADAYPDRTFELVSGYRPHARPGSRHRAGRALDLRVEGVDNHELSELARTLEATGVGYYPNSSFVHLDVRDSSFYWVDRSGPGERPRYVKGPDGAALDAVDESPRDTKSAPAEVAAVQPTAEAGTALDAELRSLTNRALVVMNASLGISGGFDKKLPGRHEL